MSAQSPRKIIYYGIIVILAFSVTGIWYWGFYIPAQEAEEQARQEQIARAEAEKKRQEEAKRKKERYDQLIAEGDAAFDEENWVTAQNRYSDALKLFPNESYPQSQLILTNQKLDEIAEKEARRAAGEVETVQSPTARFYLIVSSSIDEDLAMDYARKLAKEGYDIKLVQHNYNELPFHGVSVADFGTWNEATAAMGAYSSLGQLWVLKY